MADTPKFTLIVKIVTPHTTTNKEEDFDSISKLIESGLLGSSRKQIMRMIDEGVKGKKLPVELVSTPYDPRGTRYIIKRKDVIAYAKYLKNLN